MTTVPGTAMADTLVGTSVDDLILGYDGADSLVGLAGADLIYGNQGADVVYGNQGNDTLYVGQGDDRAFGGQGDDRLYGNRGNDTLSGNFGADIVYGNQGDDIVYGNQGSDILYGGQGADILYGGQGNDTLVGGLGADTLIGGIGNDLLVGDSSDTAVMNGTRASFAITRTADGSYLLAGADGTTRASGVGQYRFNDGTLAASQLIPVETGGDGGGSAPRGVADLSVTTSVSNPTPKVGDLISVSVAAANAGPDAASRVAVRDLLPPGLRLASASFPAGSYDPITGIWNVGTIAGGTTRTLTLRARAIDPSTLTTTASITLSDQDDPSTTNNTATVSVTPSQADLALTKTVDNAAPNVGEFVVFTTSATNTGSSVAADVSVIDLLPSGAQFISATPSQGTYNPTTGAWIAGTLPGGATGTLSIRARVVTRDALTSSAAITSSDQSDPTTTNNVAAVTVTPQKADLVLTNTVSDSAPNVGGRLTFTVTATNAGPNAATGVAIANALPAGVALVAALPSQGTYDPATGTWTIGTIATGSAGILTLIADVTSPNRLTSTASVVSSDQFDTLSVDNQASVSATPQQADLVLISAVDNPTPNVGDVITYTFRAANNGPSAATSVVVGSDQFIGVAILSASASGGSYDLATSRWSVGTIPQGTTSTLTIMAKVTAPTLAPITASILASDQYDPSSANNSSRTSADPMQISLALTNSVSNSNPNVGDIVTFSINTLNAGPSAATGVVVNSTLPSGAVFVSATPSMGTYDPATGRWVIGGIATSETTTLTIAARVASPSAMTATASIAAADQFETSASDNVTSATISPQQADLSLSSSVSKTRPGAGEVVNFAIKTRNQGPSTATGVRIQDTLPAGVTFISAVSSHGTYDAATGTWDVGTLANGATGTLEINARVDSAAVFTNSSTIVASDQFDPNTSNNSITVTAVPQRADISLINVVSNQNPTAGDLITYTVRAINAGADIATGVAIQDALPAGASFVSAAPSQGTYDPATGAWNIGTIVNGTTSTLAITARVIDPAALASTATVVAADQFDPDTANNTASTVGVPNLAPTANPDSYMTTPDTQLLIMGSDLVFNDTDPNGGTLIPTNFTSPTHGTLTSTNGNYVYTPNQGFVGSDSFTYVAFDGLANSAATTVTLTVSP